MRQILTFSVSLLQNVAAWVKFADLEKSLAEYDRARYLFELAIEQPVLDMPELLWKTYIDFEAELEEYDKVTQQR